MSKEVKETVEDVKQAFTTEMSASVKKLDSEVALKMNKAIKTIEAKIYPMKINTKKLSSDAQLPTRATEGSAAYDLYASQDKYLERGTRSVVNTGIAIEIPDGYVGLICPRSGMAAKNGITILNGPGVIDQDYLDEVKVILHNTDADHKIVKKGERVAQIMFIKYEEAEFVEAEFKKPKTSRKGGLGSTNA